MGFGFVIIIHLIVILSFVISIITGMISFFTSKKPKRKRRIFFSVLSPYVFLYSFYFFWFVGGLLISINKDVNMKIGDYWYAPINQNHTFSYIDLPEQAFIEGKKISINSFKAVQKIEEKLLINNNNDSFKVLNLNTNVVTDYNNLTELKRKEGLENSIELINNQDFHSKLRNEAIGYWDEFVLILSLCLSIFSVIGLKKKLN